MPSVTIVIPVYNQEKNLGTLFSATDSYIREQKEITPEIVLVNDGSTDASEKLMNEFASSRSGEVKVVSYRANKGRGYAVRKGMLTGQGDYRIVMDADLAASFAEVSKALVKLTGGCDVVIGSRRIPGAMVLTPPSPLRWFLGMGFIYLARTITGVPVSDFSCGFKGYTKEATARIFPYTKIERWSHDAENLYVAKKNNLRICEVPLIWENGAETKVRVGRDILWSFFELLRIRFIHH